MTICRALNTSIPALIANFTAKCLPNDEKMVMLILAKTDEWFSWDMATVEP